MISDTPRRHHFSGEGETMHRALASALRNRLPGAVTRRER